MEIALSLVPVVLFLVFLFVLDSFKLVFPGVLVFVLLWGVVAAGIAYLLNGVLLSSLWPDFQFYTRYVAPVVEELLKSFAILYLLRRRKIGFLIDAAIYGFAVGAGFSLVENGFYLMNADDHSLLIWVVRGLGTALMHGGCTALLAVVFTAAKQVGKQVIVRQSIGVLLAVLIHSGFNHFLLNPLLQTLALMLVLPALFVLIFRFNERELQRWLEVEFTTEVELLQMIRKGQFLGTKAGEYLASLKNRFAPEVLLDMYCYFSLYLELSIKAKRNLMFRENGFAVPDEPEVKDQLKELKALRKNIGKAGELTLSPLIRMSYRDLWKLNLLA